MRPFNPAYIFKVIPDLLSFLPVTLLMILGTILFGSLLGLVLARAKVEGGQFARTLATAYTVAMRCTPPIVLLFIVFYGLPELLNATIGLDINSIYKGIFVIITFTLLFAANMSEVMRSAYESIDKGQREAALSIGLSEFQAFYRIVLPQATAVALPNFGNALINLMKDGSLAYTIGLIDMMGQGTLIIARNQGGYGLETYLALAIVYWTLTIMIEKIFAASEHRLIAGQRTVAA